MTSKKELTLVIKQNVLKNLTVLAVTAVLCLWVYPYALEIGEGGLDAFFFLSIFPLGAMFAYFAFRYSDTNLHSTEHRMLADIATFIFLVIICFAVSFSSLIGSITMPTLAAPFIVLSGLLITGCLVYDFWNLYCNVKKQL